MLTLLPQSYVAWKVVVTTFHCIAVLSTLLRFSLRLRANRMMVDDFLVFIPSGFAMWLCVDLLLTNRHSVGYTHQVELVEPRGPSTINYWKSAFVYSTVIWGSRMALCLSFVRLFPSKHGCRPYSRAVAAFMVSIWMIIPLVSVFGCKDSKWGTKMELSKCVHLTKRDLLAPFIFSVANLASNVLLTVCPLYLVLRLKLPTDERRLMVFLFASTLTTLGLCVGVITLSYAPILQDASFYMVLPMLNHLECAIALFVANFLTLAGFLFGAYRRRYPMGQNLFGWRISRLDTLKFSHSMTGVTDATSLAHHYRPSGMDQYIGNDNNRPEVELDSISDWTSPNSSSGTMKFALPQEPGQSKAIV